MKEAFVLGNNNNHIRQYIDILYQHEIIETYSKFDHYIVQNHQEFKNKKNKAKYKKITLIL